MAKNRIFFPQEALDALLADGSVELRDDELLVKSEGRRYRLAEAARIVGEVTGGGDTFSLVGRVKSVRHLTELGAEVLGTSMILGENAYDVVPGFLGAPIGSFAEHAEAQRGSPEAAHSDEDLLGKLLLRVL